LFRRQRVIHRTPPYINDMRQIQLSVSILKFVSLFTYPTIPAEAGIHG
jgi:hypothetical protein